MTFEQIFPDSTKGNSIAQQLAILHSCEGMATNEIITVEKSLQNETKQNKRISQLVFN